MLLLGDQWPKNNRLIITEAKTSSILAIYILIALAVISIMLLDFIQAKLVDN